jgi:uncharacterized protein (DUF302 family)
MLYHYSKKLRIPFDVAIDKISESLREQGFGVLTSIDVKETLKKKLDVDFRNYRILGACNPKFAHRALSLEPHIGVMLPCNVVVQDAGDGVVEISAINPMETMDKTVGTQALKEIATEVSERLRNAIDSISDTR